MNIPIEMIVEMYNNVDFENKNEFALNFSLVNKELYNKLNETIRELIIRQCFRNKLDLNKLIFIKELYNKDLFFEMYEELDQRRIFYEWDYPDESNEIKYCPCEDGNLEECICIDNKICNNIDNCLYLSGYDEEYEEFYY